jgi:hypothetical protein
MSVGESLPRRPLSDIGLCQDFSNIVSKSAIERLAEMDEHEVVKEFQVNPPLVIIKSLVSSSSSHRNISQIMHPCYLRFSP